MSSIGQKFSRLRIHVENRTKAFKNFNSWLELDKGI